ncbi:uncharacterized protein N7482_004371 [Penicillium canariense]|uniref:Uncharacterized protein n=1 Tax=Penicillium canariense TaxID=189055 RepID=A0A9W9LPI0_9EURO|nr:uncharacterized protein N7482_004371 [Penicillium canariense]KAJ5168777.1 hypothetical protein N7482_004371 [Penicillium canariense]
MWVLISDVSNIYQIAIWSVLISGLENTAGSLITLRPLFRWLLNGSMSYGRNAPSRQDQPLSCLGSETLKSAPSPSYWRPDLNLNSEIVVTNPVSPPQSHNSRDDGRRCIPSLDHPIYVTELRSINHLHKVY